MTQPKRILTSTGEPMLSAKNAAKRLSCAQDYVSKLCREGKLRGTQIQGAWFVEEASINEFELIRAQAKVERSEGLARLRKEESEAYRKERGLAEQAPVSFSAPAPFIEKFFNALTTSAGRNAALALGGILLFGAVALGSTAAYGQRSSLAASLAQVESPFFGSHAMTVSLSGSGAHSITSEIFSNILGFIFGTKPQLAVEPAPVVTPVPAAPSVPVPSTPVTPVVTRPTPTQTPIVQNNTYPVVERTVERVVSGVTEDMLTEKLSVLANALRQEIFGAINNVSPTYSGGGFTNNLALSQKIDHLDGVTITNATISNSTFNGSSSVGSGSGTVGGSGTAGQLAYWSDASTLAATSSPSVSFITAQTASTTQLFGALLTQCDSGNVLTWNNGFFGCTPDQTAAGQANPFTWSSNYGVVAMATTSPFWAQSGIFASSTSHFTALTTNTLSVGSLQGLLYGTNGSVGTIATNTLGLLASSSISATAPLAYNVATGVFSITQANGSQDGYLASSDFNSFNARLSTSTLGLFDKGYFFSTTSANYFLTQSNTFSTTSTDYWKTQNNFFSTTSASYFLAQNQGNAFSTTSANNFINASSTIPHALGAAYGDVFIWNGSNWIATATSTLGIVSTGSGSVFGKSWEITGNYLAPTSTIGIIVSASSTFNGALTVTGNTTLTDATTTNLNITGTASTTRLFGAGLASCQGGNVLTWNGGLFGCVADQTSAGQANAFSFATNYGVITAATTSPIWAQSGIFASSTSFFANASFTNATTSSLYIGSLNGPLQAINGRISATSTLSQVFGGTGISSYSSGDILYADLSGNLAKLPIGSSGQVLKVSAGLLPSWGADQTSGGGGGASAWATTTDSLAVYPSNTSNVIIIGNSATSTLTSIFEVIGKSYFSNNVGIGTTSASSLLSLQGNALFSGNLGVANITATGTITAANLSINSLTGLLYGTNGSVGTIATNTLGLLASSSISATAPLAYNVATGVFSITQAGTGANGYLSQADFNTFNNKISSTSLSAGNGISYNSTTGVITNTIGYLFPNNATGTQIAFNGGLTATNATFTNSTSTNATTTNLAITGVTNALLKTLSSGAVVAAVAGTDYLTTATVAAFPFTPGINFGVGVNSTSTAINFTQGLFASSTSQFTAINTLFATTTNLLSTGSTTIAGAFNAVGGATLGTVSAGATTLSSLTVPGLSTFTGGFIAASSTINGNATTTGTFFASVASSTSLYGAGLASCQGGNVLTWNGGVFGCSVDQTSTGAANNFNFATNYGVLTAATTSPIWAQSGIFASSSSYFVNATTTSFGISNIVSSLLKTTSAGSVIAAIGGTDYENPLTFNGPLSRTLNAISISQSGTGANGYLSSTDFSTFNNKISSTSLSATGVIAYSPVTGVVSTTPGTFNGSASSVYTFPGDLIVTGTATTSNLYLSGKITGANLSSCSGAADKLLWNSTTGQFTCGTDAGSGGGSGEINWTYFNGSGVRVSTSSNQVLIGFTSTSSLSKLEVVGGATFDNATTTNGLSVGGIASFAGSVGVGTTTPSQKFTVAGGNILQIASGNPTLASSTFLGTGSQAYASFISGRFAYVAANGGGLKILDITNPGAPALVGTYSGISAAKSVVVSGKYAYVGDSTNGLVIIDVSRPSSPTLVSSIAAGNALSLALSGRYVVVPDFDTGTVNIVDVANPTSPSIVGSYTTGTSPASVAVSGKYAYVGDTTTGTGGIYVTNISNPASPVAVSNYTGLTTPTGLYVSGRYLYVTDTADGLHILDISNPGSLSETGSYTAGGGYYSVQVAGDYAYVTNPSGDLAVLDVKNPANVTSVGSLTVGNQPRGVTVAGKYVYVGATSNTFKVVDINGTKLPSASIGALDTNIANVSDTLSVGADLFVGGGVNVGLSGIFSRGGLAVFGSTTLTDLIVRNSTTTNATTTSLFSTTASSTNLSALNARFANATTTSLYIGTLSGLLTSTNGLVSSVATSSLGLLASTSIQAQGPLSFNSSTGVFSIAQSGASTDGYLSSTDYNNFNSRLSTTTLGLFDKGYFFSTTSAQNFVNSSTTIPKTYTANIFTQLQTFSQGFLSSASSSVNGNLSVVGTASTTNLNISSIATGNLLKTTTAGSIIAAVAGTDYATPSQVSSAYPFALAGNATSTLTQFNGGLTAFASSTIGDGTQIGGLTVSGGATTTGNAYFAGSVSFPNLTSSATTLNIGGDIDLFRGAVNRLDLNSGDSLNLVSGNISMGGNVVITSGSVLRASNGTVNAPSISFQNDNNTGLFAVAAGGVLGFSVEAVERGRFDSNGNFGIGTSSPLHKLDVQGDASFATQVLANYFTATSSTASTFPFASTTAITATNASTTNLTISSIASGSLLKTTTAGSIIAAVAGTDYVTPSTDSAGNWFTPSTFGVSASNATSTLIGFTNGIYSLASSTIGNGNQNGGLTILGGATTTGNAVITGTLNVSSTGTFNSLSLGSSNRITFGTSNAGWISGDSTKVTITGGGTSALVYFSTGTNVSVGTTSPTARLTVAATSSNSNLPLFDLQSPTTAGFATSSVFKVSAVGSTTLFQIPSSILKTDSNGTIIAAVAGTDYVTPGSDSVGNWFTPTTYGNATSTTIGFTAGLLSVGSTTINGSATTTGSLSVFASTTVSGQLNAVGGATFGALTAGATTLTSTLSVASLASLTGGFLSSASSSVNGNLSVVGTASTTNLNISSIASGSLLKTTTAGSIIAAVAGTDYATPSQISSAFDFTPATNYGINVNSTTTPIWLKLGLQASSTSNFDQITVGSSTASQMATSTFFGNVSVRGAASTTSLYISLLSAGGLGIDSNGKVYAGATSTLSTISGTLALSQLAAQGANTIIGNLTGGSAVPTAISTTSLFAALPGQVLTFNNGVWAGVSTTTNSCSSGVTCSFAGSTWSFTNSGVTTLTAGNGISLSGSTGAVTVTNTVGYPFLNNATSTALSFTGGLTTTNASTTNISGNTAAFGGTATTSIASNGALTIQSLSGLLKATNGLVSAAVAGTDYLTSANVAAFPFTPSTNFGVTSNSTSTLISFNAGLAASSTSHFANLDYTGTLNFASTSANASSTLLSFNGETFLTASSTGFNTGLGLNALANVTSGNSNTAFGAGAGQTTTSGNNNILIGVNAVTDSPATSNQLNIGNTFFGDLLNGTIGIGTTTPFGILSVVGNGSAGVPLLDIANNLGTPVFQVSNSGSTTLYQIPSSLLKTDANGTIIAAVAGTDYLTSANVFAFPFTPTTNYGVNTSATSTPIFARSAIFASSTSQFDQINVGSSTGSTLATSTFFGNLSVQGNSSTTNLFISSIASGNILKTTAAGKIVAAVAGTDYALPGAGAYPFTPSLFGATAVSATGTALQLTGGLFASSTVQFGNAGVAGFTFDGATGNLGLGSTTPMSKLAVVGGNITQVVSGTPTLKGTYTTSATPEGVYVSGNYAYVADSTTGLQIFDITNPAFPVLEGTYNTSGSAQDVVVSGKYAYVADGTAGLQIIDVSNPASPVLLGTYDTTLAWSVYVSGKYAYVADDSSGLEIIDISNPASPALAGNYDTTGSSRGVYVSDKYAYVGDGSFGLQIIDISNPAAPSLAGTYNTSGTAKKVYVSGKYAYVADAASGLQIIDISNPAVPVLRGTYDTPDTAYQVSVSGKYAYVADYIGGLQIIDVSSSTAPSLAGAYTGLSSIFSAYISGKYAYVIDQTTGLQILDINGAEVPALYAGNIQTSALNVTENINAGGNIYAQGGLNVGISGIFSRGGLGVFVASTTAANPIAATFMGGGVGVGTTTPTQSLSIHGNSYVSGSGFFGGAVTATSTLSVLSLSSLTGFLSSASSTINGNATTTGTFFASIASSTNLYGAGLATCNSGNVLTWSAGIFGCAADATGAVSGANPFTWSNNFGVLSAATTSPIWAQSGIFASSTSNFDQITVGSSTASQMATSTFFGNVSVRGAASTTNLFISSIASGSLLKTTTAGSIIAAVAGTDYATPSQISSAYPFPNNATGTQIAFNGGLTAAGATTSALTVTASTTVSGQLNAVGGATFGTINAGGVFTSTATGANVFPYASTTVITASLASTSALIVSGLNAASCDVKANTDGTLVCGTDATGTGGASYPFTPGVFGGTAVSATGTALQLTGGLFASSTVQFGNAGISGLLFDGATGKLGLGTTTPWAQLSVNPNGTAGPAFAIGSSTATLFSVTYSGGGTAGAIFDYGSNSTSTIKNNTVNAWSLATSSTAKPLFTLNTTSGAEEVTIGSGYTSDVIIGAVGAASNLVFEESSTISGQGGNTLTFGQAGDKINFAVNTGFGTTTPVSTVSIQGSLCVRDTGSCGTTNGVIYATTAALTDIDLAEVYAAADTTLAAGEIVSLDTTASTTIKRAQLGDQLFGIISTKPGLLLGKEIQNGKPVALKGRVPLKVNLEGGAIAVGDAITLSSVPGVGTRATTTTQKVGVALEPYTGFSTSSVIEVFVENGMYFTPEALEVLNSATTTAPALVAGPLSAAADTLKSAITGAVSGAIKVFNTAIYASVGVFDKVFTQTLTATVVNAETVNTKTLCLDGLCITKDQLQSLLNGQGNGGGSSAPPPAPPSGGGNSGGGSGTSTPDTEAPVITLNGNNPATVSVGSVYTDLGAIVTDNVDQNLGFTVSLNGGPSITLDQLSLDTSTSTTQTIVFSATDQAGNVGTATRTVIVEMPAP